MTISIDWGTTKVITVEKEDMVLIQSEPLEIYNLDLNGFRLKLLDLQDDVEGRPWQKTFNHETETEMGGITYARKIILLDPYSVTFEDDQYAVNLVGANSNIGDKVNVNQVSVRSANSAGMTSSPDIEYASFNGGITYDSTNGIDGTLFPTGTPRQPSSNIYDSRLIANYRGFTKGYIKGDLDIPLYEQDGFTPFVLNNFVFYGDGRARTAISIPDEATIFDCTFIFAEITGYLDGDNSLQECFINDLHYVKGYIQSCVLSGTGEVELGGGNKCSILDSFTGEGIATINLGGAGQPLVVENHNGSLRLENKSGTEDVRIGTRGDVIIDLLTTINGTATIKGEGCVFEQNGNLLSSGNYGDLILINKMTSNHSIATAVWSNTDHNHDPDSHGAMLHRLKYMERSIYIDTEAIINGDGSEDSPFNDLTTAIDFAELNVVRRLIVYSDIVLDRKMKNFNIYGVGKPTVDTNGQDLDKSEFTHCKLEGTYVGAIRAYECMLLNGFLINGGFNGCGTMESLITLSGGSVVLNEPFNAHAGIYHTEVSMNSGGVSNLAIHGADGRFTVTDCDHVDDTVTVVMSGGHLVFSDSCVDGTMVALGCCEFDNLVVGATVINRTSPSVLSEAVLNTIS